MRRLKSFAAGRYCQILLLILISSLLGCSSEEEPIDLSIAINPWPSFDMLLLAKDKGFFREEGINADILEFNTLLDANSAFLTGRADVVCGTLFEVLINRDQLAEDTEIMLVTDYSNGADVILVDQSIENIAGLKGKTVGVELGSLGEHVLLRALAKQGLSMKDVNIHPLNQTDMMSSVNNGEVQAVVSYPPFILPLLEDPNWKAVFSSKEIPYEIVALLSIRSAYAQAHPALRGKLLRVWDRTLAYVKENKDESYKFLAAQEGMSVQAFSETLATIKLMTTQEQSITFDLQGPLQMTVRAMHKSLHEKEAISMQIPANNFMPAQN